MSREEARNSAGSRTNGLHGWMVACALFALAGLVASGISWRTHWQVRSAPPTVRPSCTLSESTGCADTARSSYAVVLGVPIALWSACGFGALLVLAVLGLRRRPDHAFPTGLLFAVAGLAAAAGVTMALIARFVLGVFCVECTVIQVLAVATFACAALQLREVRLGPSRALAADVRRLVSYPRTTVAVTLFGAAGVLLLVVFYPEHEWRAPGIPGLPPGAGTLPLSGQAGIPGGVTAEGHPYLGAAEPRVTVVEYSDYQCPVCRGAHAALRDMVARHPDRIRLVHVHLPLDQACNRAVPRPFHVQACELARAAVCAERAGRFWEMNDALFEHQDDRARLDAVTLAPLAGIADSAALRGCIDGPDSDAAVRRDIEQGIAALAGVGPGLGTPAFEIFDASGRLAGRYLGIGGDDGLPEDVLRRLDAGWPEETGETSPQGDGR
ncbi:MAG: thioredoxin domain-containing protein [Deltaproteobacteria bacterium]|nr:thioredoxin domain-containing protein [Deltaproteobacteria bacterium]